MKLRKNKKALAAVAVVAFATPHQSCLRHLLAIRRCPLPGPVVAVGINLKEGDIL
jgi:hypothetical protein